jgi:hypothetical protein
MFNEIDDPRRRRDEVFREQRERRLPDYNQQPHAMPYYSRKLVRLVADAHVVTDRDPLFFTHGFQPDFIRAVGAGSDRGAVLLRVRQQRRFQEIAYRDRDR